MYDFADIYKKDQFAYSYMTLHEWFYKKQKGKKVEDFFIRHGIHTLAIYSLGTLGNIFLDEMISGNQASIRYIIDKNAKRFLEQIQGVPIIGLDEVSRQEAVDRIVICHVFYYNQIADDLIRQGIDERALLSLNDIVFSL